MRWLPLTGDFCWAGRATASPAFPLLHRAMDMSWITERIAVGGGIWNEANMIAVVRAGITHVINMQVEFDERSLAQPYGIEVLWNPIDDDFLPKSPEIFQRGVEFAQSVLAKQGSKLYVHCAAGVHRGPMMALAILCADGWELEEAQRLIQSRRPVVDWAPAYTKSIQSFLRTYSQART